MTIQQLQYVLEIARTGSVSQTARNLFLSQPNISNAVKNLEAELGVAVFQRTATGMALTPEGRRLVRRAGGDHSGAERAAGGREGPAGLLFQAEQLALYPGL